MSDLRHIYRNLKLKHIPSKRYNRKYDPKYLDELASKGCSVKLGFGDFDGDTDLDGTYPKQRAVVAEKPGLHINKPLRGPRNLSFPPSEGPVLLSGAVLPEFGPTQLSAISLPAFGPSQLSAALLPEFGPTVLSSNIQPPIEGPSLAEFPATPSGDRRVKVVEPALGPSNLEEVPEPQVGPVSLSSTVVKPAGSISTLIANITAPAAGPSSLLQIQLPPTGFNGSSLNLTSSILAPVSGPTFPSSNSTQIAPPSNGVSNLTGLVEAVAPTVGPSQLSSAISYDLIDHGGRSVSFYLQNMELSEDGTTLAYSRANDDDGQIYVWQRSISNGTWIWSPKGPTIFGGTDNYQDMLSLSGDGSHLIAAGPHKVDPSAPSGTYSFNHGYFKVYYWNSSANYWVPKGSIIHGLQLSRFGEGVAISKTGQVVAIGGPFYNQSNSWDGINTGYFEVYEWDGSSAWVQRGSTIHGSNRKDYYGYELDLSDDGSVLLMSNNKSFGKVYEWDGSEYVQKGSTLNSGLTATSGTVASNKRNSITGDGNTIAISWGVFLQSITRVYEWSGSDWVQKGSDIGNRSGGNYGDGDGVWLSNNGSIVAVAEGNSATVKLYRYENTDWVLMDEISNASTTFALSKDATSIAAYRDADEEWRVYQNLVTS